MKKYLLLLVLAVILTGCKKNENENLTDTQYREYKNYVETVDAQKNFDKEIDECDIKVIINKTNKENYRYDVIIDNPTIEMYNIKAIAKLEVTDDYSYASIGILEDDVFSLIPNVVDKPNNVYKGINLSNVSVFSNKSIYLYLTYTQTKDSEGKRVERFVEVIPNAS